MLHAPPPPRRRRRWFCGWATGAGQDAGPEHASTRTRLIAQRAAPRLGQLRAREGATSRSGKDGAGAARLGLERERRVAPGAGHGRCLRPAGLPGRQASTRPTPFTGWLYRVNHVAPRPAADQFAIDKATRSCGFCANFGTGANTGDELVLGAPFRATPGVPSRPRSLAFDFNGVSKPAPDGTVVSGGTAPAATVGGVAWSPWRRGNDPVATGPGASSDRDPLEPGPLCVAVHLSECPAAPREAHPRQQRARRDQGHPGLGHDPRPRRQGRRTAGAEAAPIASTAARRRDKVVARRERHRDERCEKGRRS